jgi:hypothetical protein
MFIVLVELDVLAVPVQPSRFSAPKMPSKPETWLAFCKSRSRTLTLASQRWHVTLAVVVVVAAGVVVAVIVEVVAVAVAVSLLPTPPLWAEVVGKR